MVNGKHWLERSVISRVEGVSLKIFLGSSPQDPVAFLPCLQFDLPWPKLPLTLYIINQHVVCRLRRSVKIGAIYIQNPNLQNFHLRANPCITSKEFSKFTHARASTHKCFTLQNILIPGSLMRGGGGLWYRYQLIRYQVPPKLKVLVPPILGGGAIMNMMNSEMRPTSVPRETNGKTKPLLT